MLWHLLNKQERITIVLLLQKNNFTQAKIAVKLGTIRENIRDFCRNNKIYGWHRGGQLRNTNAAITGFSRTTVKRKTKEVVIEAGKDPRRCERCKSESDQNLPRHHKNRNREDNDPNNIEVLCSACHAKEHVNERIRESSGKFSS